MPRRPPLSEQHERLAVRRRAAVPPGRALLTVALAAACSTSPAPASGPVTVAPAHPLAAQAQASCATLVTQLPLTLGDAARRVTSPDPQTTAAWGDPAITLVCGGPTGSPLDDSFTVDGVRWAVHDVGAARTWTTVDRDPAVVVTMPDAYQNQAELLGAMVGPLSAVG